MPVHTSTDKSVTRYVMLMITYRCNLNCIYCYERYKNDKIIHSSDAKNYIQEIYQETLADNRYKAIEIDFSGGEPLTQFNIIKEISEWIWSNQWKIPFILFAPTNGTLLNNEMKIWFSENKHRIALGLSYDGLPLIQNINRSSSSKLVDLDFFLQTWPEQQVKMTVSKQSLPYLADGVIYLHAKGVKAVFANLAYGIEWSQSDLVMYKQQLDILIAYYLNNPQIKRSSLLNYDLSTSLSFSNLTKKICGCGTGTVFIDVDGKRYPCQMFSPISMGEDKLKRVNCINFHDEDKFCFKECCNCVLRNICPKCFGMNYIENGDISKPPAFLCQSFKIQFLENCKLIELMIGKGQIKENVIELQKIIEIVKSLFKF